MPNIRKRSQPEFWLWCIRLTKVRRGFHGRGAIGAGIATAVANNQNYNDCMEARGWRIADDVKPTTVGAPRPAATILTATTASSAVAPLPGNPQVPATSRRPFLAKVADVGKETAIALRMDGPRGVVLMDVVAGGGAAASGLIPGDVILAFNGTPVEGVADLSRDLDTISGGGRAQVTIWRNDAERSLIIRL